jgi:hypothetical protein
VSAALGTVDAVHTRNRFAFHQMSFTPVARILLQDEKEHKTKHSHDYKHKNARRLC